MNFNEEDKQKAELLIQRIVNAAKELAKLEEKAKKPKKPVQKELFEGPSLELARRLLNRILERKPDHKCPDIQAWAGEIDKMLRLDKRREKSIEKVIDYAQNHEFWKNNILSAVKLRKHFDRLEMEMNAPKKEQICEEETRKKIDKAMQM